VIAKMALALAMFSAAALIQAQSVPAVIADPSPDKQFPAATAILTIPSHGVDMDGFLYLAAGAAPHGTVMLLHGLPGYEINGDLAQAIRRAGWNVLIFHYRGTWGTAGSFSQSSAIEDTMEAVKFLRDRKNAARYRIDPQRVVVIGHSFGGFLAGYAASHDSGIAAVGILSATNLGKINNDPKEREARLKRWETQLHPVRGATASELFAEAERHAKEWDYVQWADALRSRQVLLIEADDQNRPDMEALAAALRKKGAATLQQIAIPSDHSFSDHRIAFQSAVVEWLQNLK